MGEICSNTSAMKKLVTVLFGAFFLSSCQEKKEGQKPKEIVQTNDVVATPAPRKTFSYQKEKAKLWFAKHKADSLHQMIAFAVNRTDKANFVKMDTVLIPAEMTSNLKDYLPFPYEVPSLREVEKVVFFSYPTQTFAAFEKGVLVRTGPTNMGRKKDKTPTGLFFTNWKAEETISTFNDEWKLRWNFNIANKEGIGWHQYALPGYPASHSCLRLQENDALYLYEWADQWMLNEKEDVVTKGTPVIVFGDYDFAAPKPWLQLLVNPHALDISEDELQKVTAPFLTEMLSVQNSRQTAKSVTEQ